jgi:hypothetical protein
MEIVKSNVGSMQRLQSLRSEWFISVGILWYFKGLVTRADKRPGADALQAADTAATAVDAPPHAVSDQDEGGHQKGASATPDEALGWTLYQIGSVSVL